MTEEEKEELNNLVYLLEIHHIGSDILFKMKNLIQNQQEKIEYYKSQKTYDDQFKAELLETIRCKGLEIDSLNKILDDRLVCIQGGRGLYAKLKGLDKEYLIREYLSMYKMCKQELEKKDKIIDEMAKKILEEGIIWKNKEEIKKYFEKKVEDKQYE